MLNIIVKKVCNCNEPPQHTWLTRAYTKTHTQTPLYLWLNWLQFDCENKLRSETSWGSTMWSKCPLKYHRHFSGSSLITRTSACVCVGACMLLWGVFFQFVASPSSAMMMRNTTVICGQKADPLSFPPRNYINSCWDRCKHRRSQCCPKSVSLSVSLCVSIPPSTSLCHPPAVLLPLTSPNKERVRTLALCFKIGLVPWVGVVGP